MSFLWEMELEVYHCLESVKPDYASFIFHSEGPNGGIMKVVRYQLVEESIYGQLLFNLSFGDWNDVTKTINDRRVSRNGDDLRVLATVAHTVVTVTNKWGGCRICVKGSTPGRTRLYQMKINAYWSEINKLFFIQGRVNERWEEFRRDKNYDTLSVTRR